MARKGLLSEAGLCTSDDALLAWTYLGPRCRLSWTQPAKKEFLWDAGLCTYDACVGRCLPQLNLCILSWSQTAKAVLICDSKQIFTAFPLSPSLHLWQKKGRTVRSAVTMSDGKEIPTTDPGYQHQSLGWVIFLSQIGKLANWLKGSGSALGMSYISITHPDNIKTLWNKPCRTTCRCLAAWHMRLQMRQMWPVQFCIVTGKGSEEAYMETHHCLLASVRPWSYLIYTLHWWLHLGQVLWRSTWRRTIALAVASNSTCPNCVFCTFLGQNLWFFGRPKTMWNTVLIPKLLKFVE